MRVTTVLCAMGLVGCASLGGGTGRETVSQTVDVPVDTAVRIARTQLELHNYRVGATGGSTLITEPRAVPGEVRDAAASREAEYWVVRVDVGRKTLGGTEIKVRDDDPRDGCRSAAVQRAPGDRGLDWGCCPPESGRELGAAVARSLAGRSAPSV